jgi:hypothetical protein
VGAVSADVHPRENNSGRGPLRGYAPWRPQAKTQLLLERVLAVLDEYAAYLPLTCRQVFYRLVGAHGSEKTEQAYDRLLYALDRARRAELVPFEALRDDGIVVMRNRWFGEPADFWDDVARQAREFSLHKQVGQRAHVELWCEAAGMMPQLRRVADRYSVEVYSCGGSASLTAVRGIVRRVVKRNVPTILLHVGDFDPDGEAIYGAMTEDAVAFLERDALLPGVHRVDPVRVALTAEQVGHYGLPTAPPKVVKTKTGAAHKGRETINARWRERHGDRTAQAEALPPDVLAGIVSEAIEAHLDLDLVRAHQEAEPGARVQLLRALPSGNGHHDDDELPL